MNGPHQFMNILVFTTAFFPSVGGLENQTVNLLDEFLKKGHKVKVIAFQSHHTHEMMQINKQKVEVYYNPNFFSVLSLFIWCKVFYMPNFSLKGTWFLPFLPFKKWIVSHNDLYLSKTTNFTIKLKLLAIKLASENIAVSNYVAKYVKSNTRIIYNCYDNEVFKIYHNEQKQFNFIFLGRLVSQKGCDLLIRACSNLDPSFSLNIIGDGPERECLENLVKSLKLEKNIRFLGIVEGEPLARLLNKHDTMVIPSVQEEGFGIVALEGMACGCKIIAANAGGLPEAVNGFGKLFDMGNQHELEELLKNDLKESKIEPPFELNAEMQQYLCKQHKKVIAEEYLKLFV